MDIHIANEQDLTSDYGSDFTPDEEEILHSLLHTHGVKSETCLDLLLVDKEDDKISRSARLPSRRLSHEIQLKNRTATWQFYANKNKVQIEIEGYESSPATFETPVNRQEKLPSEALKRPQEPVPEPVTPDLRSPLERFRTKPKKPLSVTDLVSPSWCELQYWYNLTKYGKKRPTPVMKRGSKVHKRLEDEVHQTVPVEIQTKEDAWGLRIWNIIQGLRTLQETGITRELEVWGVIDGLVVNGVIDELSYICPDRELEEGAGPSLITQDTLPADQSSITKFLRPDGSQNNGRGVRKDINTLPKKKSRIYITDVKTRTVKAVPKGASFRPTLMQLMLYHRLFSDMATNRTDSTTLFDRFSLNPTQPFSDTLVAQISSISEDFQDALFDPENSNKTPLSQDETQDSMHLILNHNSLSALWTLMIQEFQRAMPAGLDSIGNVLKAEYRAQSDGAIMGIKTFLNDNDVMQSYLDDELRWWRGEREARGVCVEEAYKCGSCEFAEACSWRRERIEEATERHRARTRSVV